MFIGIVFFVSAISLTYVQIASANSETTAPNGVTLNFFWGNGCPHCAQEEKFLETLEKDYPSLSIHSFEVWGNDKNRELFKKAAEKLNINISGVPFTLIGTNYISGFYTDDTTGAQIRQYIDYCLSNECTDIVSQISTTPKPTPQNLTTPEPTKAAKPVEPKADPWKNAPLSLPKEVSFPLVGKINLTTLSLPIVAAVIGTLDGFNPCAMWVLLFLISLLVNLPDKKRRWLLGLTFLLTSGLVYFFFMVAWLNILLFIGFVVWVRVAIAIFALIAGSFSLNKYLQHRIGCVVENDENRKKTFDKLKKATYDKNLWMALLGIFALAFAVNLVELLCSAGFPAIFTQILALNQLPSFHYYLYIALYIIFFMLDDILVFSIAMRTLEVTGISTRYAKYSNLIGGLLMILIGALLIFKPSYLMFNF